jgi:enamine deaminase RidA (YjgF/YER057c/UK114 family)
MATWHIIRKLQICTSSLSFFNQLQKPNVMETTMTKPSVEFLNPDSLHKNPAYSQVVVTKGAVRTVYIGGQNAVNEAGEVVGKGDMNAQATQILKNLKYALKAADAEFGNIIKWNIYILQGQNIQPAFEVFQKEIKTMSHPPLITGVHVAGLANPDFLLEIEAIAVVPE